jgi:hypothetical protein
MIGLHMNLTTRIRQIVGTGKSGYGRGQRWLYVGDSPSTKQQKKHTLELMKQNFQHVMKENDYNRGYAFKITDKKGKFLGCALMNDTKSDVVDGGYTLIHYTSDNWTDVSTKFNYM